MKLYTTSNGYQFRISRNVLTLYIPKTKGEFSADVQSAKREICLNHDLPYFSEIRITKK